MQRYKVTFKGESFKESYKIDARGAQNALDIVMPDHIAKHGVRKYTEIVITLIS